MMFPFADQTFRNHLGSCFRRLTLLMLLPLRRLQIALRAPAGLTIVQYAIVLGPLLLLSTEVKDIEVGVSTNTQRLALMLIFSYSALSFLPFMEVSTVPFPVSHHSLASFLSQRPPFLMDPTSFTGLRSTLSTKLTVYHGVHTQVPAYQDRWYICK